jgi:hypothetical protein
MRAAFEFLAYPFYFCLRVVFRVGEEIIQIVAIVAVHFAVLATALHFVEVIAEVLFELPDAQGVHAGGLGGARSCAYANRTRAPCPRGKKPAPCQYFGRSRKVQKACSWSEANCSAKSSP